MGPIFDAHPSWLSLDRNGNYFIHNKEWGDFLPVSPVNPDAQNFLINIYCELAGKYDFAGIDMDRIRYGTANHCWSDTTRILFLRDTGIDLKDLNPGDPEEPCSLAWKKHNSSFCRETLTGTFAN